MHANSSPSGFRAWQYQATSGAHLLTVWHIPIRAADLCGMQMCVIWRAMRAHLRGMVFLCPPRATPDNAVLVPQKRHDQA